MIFWFLYWFQIFKDQCGSVPSISVAIKPLELYNSTYMYILLLIHWKGVPWDGFLNSIVDFICIRYSELSFFSDRAKNTSLYNWVPSFEYFLLRHRLFSHFLIWYVRLNNPAIPTNIFEMMFLRKFTNQSQMILRSRVLFHHFYLPKVMLQVQNGNGVLNRVVSCLKCLELVCWVLHRN